MSLWVGQHAVAQACERLGLAWGAAVAALHEIAALAHPLAPDRRGRVRLTYREMPLVVVKRGGRLVTLWREDT